MNEFLFGAGVVAILSTIVTVFFLYVTRKQGKEKEFKTRAGQK